MSKKTKDKNSRRTNTDRIMTQEEYEEAKVRLEQYKAEYEWIQGTDKVSAIKEINDEAQKIRGMINGEKNSEQLYYRCYYNELAVKKYLVENNQYLAVISEKIKTLVARIKQFEIDSQEYTLRDIFNSYIGKDERTKEARKINRMLSRVRFDGLPKDINLVLQSPEQIIAHMKKYGDFVGITLPEPEVQTTELAISEGYLTKAQREYYDFINQSILGMAEKPASQTEITENIESKIDISESKPLSNENVRKGVKRAQNKDDRGLKDNSESKDDKGEINQ